MDTCKEARGLLWQLLDIHVEFLQAAVHLIVHPSALFLLLHQFLCKGQRASKATVWDNTAGHNREEGYKTTRVNVRQQQQRVKERKERKSAKLYLVSNRGKNSQ